MTAPATDTEWGADDWGDEDSDVGDDSGDEATVACPYCGEEIYEDAPQCAACGNYISAEDHATPSKPAWIVVTAVICLAMALGWVFFG